MSAEQDPVAPDQSESETGASAAVAQALATVQKAMEDLAAILGADSASALDTLKQAGQSATTHLSGLAEGARDLSQDKLDDLGAAVRRNPLAWLAAAAGVGLVIGLWRNRNPKS